MDSDFFKVITDQTGILLLAIMMIWVMKNWHEGTLKRHAERTEELKREHEVAIGRMTYLAEERKADMVMVLDVIRSNTESNNRLIAAVEGMRQTVTSDIKVTRS